MLRADGPFEVLERVNVDAYKIDLPRDYQVSATFNVSDLSSYEGDDNLSNLTLNFAKQGEDDGGPSWDSQEDQNWPLDRGHHGLTMVKETSSWEAPCWSRMKLNFVHSIC